MAKKNVTSKDPRKPAIVAALKRASGGTKVTLLKEVGPNTFEGRCLRASARSPLGRRAGFDALGTFTVKVPAGATAKPAPEGGGVVVLDTYEEAVEAAKVAIAEEVVAEIIEEERAAARE